MHAHAGFIAFYGLVQIRIENQRRKIIIICTQRTFTTCMIAIHVDLSEIHVILRLEFD